ncbi:MAG: Holliday junction resolvase RuvX [Clostridiales bacterium]|nr:Holliday junction resolvase RuvX [Clostridiales bacterium]
MKIMSIDYGDARTGIAVCDRTEFIASPIGTIEERDFLKLVQKVAYMAQQYEVKEIVVGLPLNMNGSKGPRAEKSEMFANALNQATDIPVNMWDERLTTVSAHNILNETNVRGKKRKAVVDTVSATLILEGYLELRRKKKEKEKEKEKEN